ncbi:oligosaccharide flippase family protein [Desulfomarina sp.]
MAVDHGKQPLQATALIVGKILASLSEAIIPIILVRFLPMEEVGILSGVLLVYALLAPVFATAFPDALVYFLPTRIAAERRVIAIKVALIMLLMGVVAGFLLLSLGLVAFFLPGVLARITDSVVGGVSVMGPSGLKYLLVLAFYPLGDFPARMLPNLLIIEDRAKTAATVGVVKSLLAVIAILVPVLLHLDLWVIISCYSLSGLLYGLFLVYYLLVLFPRTKGKKTVVDVSVGQIVRFAVPMGITEATMLLYNRVDQFLVALVFTASLVAQYKIGAWQIPFVTSIAYSVGAVYTPCFRTLMHEGRAEEAIRIWRLSIEKVALISVPLGLVFVVGAEELIELLFTREYLGAAMVFRLYCFLTVGRVAAFGNVLVAAGRPELIFRVAVLSFIANIFFSVPAMFLVGLEGPALGTLLAFIVHVVLFCRCIGLATGVRGREVFPLGSYLKTLSAGFAAAFCGFLLKMNLAGSAGVRFTAIALCVIGCFALFGTLSGQIKREDWDFILSLPGTVIKRRMANG